MRGAQVPGEGSPISPDLVVIGHVGVSIVHAGVVSWTSAGGSGYAVAASAAALIGDRVGLVATVGKDADLEPLRRRGVDLEGVAEVPGSSAKLRVREFSDGARSFSADLGVAATVRTETFPEQYLKAGGSTWAPRHPTSSWPGWSTCTRAAAGRSSRPICSSTTRPATRPPRGRSATVST